MQDVCPGPGLKLGVRYVERRIRQDHLARLWRRMCRLGEGVECGMGGPVGQGQVALVLVEAWRFIVLQARVAPD